MGDAISGKGILFVNSNISRHDLMDEKLFLEWYDEDHIPEILETSGVKSAWRLKDAEFDKAEKPYLSIYPMDDIGFTQTDEFRKIRVHSPLLPGENSIYDLADFDVRVYNLVQVYDPENKGTKGNTKSIMFAQMELGLDVSDEEYDKFYRDEHHEALARYPGFVRSTRYKLVFARTNAQSRALKGMETSEEAPPQPPKWLAVHEFSDEDVDLPKLYSFGGSEWTDRVVKNCKVMNAPLFKIVKEHGQGDFFHGVEA